MKNMHDSLRSDNRNMFQSLTGSQYKSLLAKTNSSLFEPSNSSDFVASVNRDDTSPVKVQESTEGIGQLEIELNHLH